MPAAKGQSLEPDRTGDCSFDPADLKKKAVCEAGWNKGYDVGKKRDDKILYQQQR